MIRSVALSDLWVLRRKPRNQVVFHNPFLLVQPHQPRWFALRCLFAGNGRDRAMHVLHDRGVRAMVQARRRQGRPEQDVMYLATHSTAKSYQPSDYDLWFRLLERLCFHSGQHAIQRIYASVWHHDRELREVFRQIGFHAYTRQIVLQLSGPDWDQGTTIAPMRNQSRQDAWAVHKLYGATTPRLVQSAEVRTPRAWMISPTHRFQSYRRRAWVLGQHDNLDAYLSLFSGTAGHVVTLLIRPDIRERVTEVLRFGLAQLHDTRPVYLMLSEYQQELLNLVENLGFQPMGDQSMMVKNAVVTIRRPVILTGFEAGLEPQITVPSISSIREDSPCYASTHRSYQ
ncbi:MAG: hypothetical protein HC837_08060 [Chloroflexaceae bacterium]|nr:hypothetical protein [Chloroflexaceae bacterium]